MENLRDKQEINEWLIMLLNKNIAEINQNINILNNRQIKENIQQENNLSAYTVYILNKVIQRLNDLKSIVKNTEL